MTNGSYLKKMLLLAGLLLAAGGPACQRHHVHGSDSWRSGEDDMIELSQVPQAAKDAAVAAVPGLELTEAELESDDPDAVYCLHGTANGRSYEVEASASGKLIDVAAGEDEEEEGEEEGEEEESEEEDD